MRRREFIKLLGGAAAWPSIAFAQQPVARVGKMPRVGLLMPGLPAPAGTSLEPFYRGLHQLDYYEGKNIAIEARYANSDAARLSVLAAELVDARVDIIVAWSTPAAVAAKQATITIPIVAALMADPIADDLVTSLARPNGNITGTTFLAPKLVAKRLQLLRDAIPKVSRITALWHPHAYGQRTMDAILRDIEDGVRTFGVTLQLVPVASPDSLEDAFSAITKELPDAFILLPSPMLFGQYKRIVAFAANNRLPAMYQSREFVDAGGLMSYGANLNDLLQLSASYVDKLIKGARPSELPIEQPTKFEFLVNMKTAKELGLAISPQLLLLADEIIE